MSVCSFIKIYNEIAFDFYLENSDRYIIPILECVLHLPSFMTFFGFYPPKQTLYLNYLRHRKFKEHKLEVKLLYENDRHCKKYKEYASYKQLKDTCKFDWLFFISNFLEVKRACITISWKTDYEKWSIDNVR